MGRGSTFFFFQYVCIDNWDNDVSVQAQVSEITGHSSKNSRQ